MKAVKTYFLNCSFHGLPFVADNRFHWTERLFWAFCVILSWWASGYVITSYYDQFVNSAISFTVDTSYLNWKSNFPAVIFCEKGNSRHHLYLNKWFGKDRDFDMDDIVKDLAFFKGVLEGASFKCKTQDENYSRIKNKKCPTGNYTMYADMIRSKCNHIFQFCSWNNEGFECCDHILPTDTVYGVCYGINSLQSRETKLNFPMTVQYKIDSSIGKLTVELHNPDVKIFVLSREEIPSYSDGNAVVFDGVSTFSHAQEDNNIYISVEEMVNEKEVWGTSINRRGCIFPDEVSLKTAHAYSYSACIVECLSNIQMEMCQCNHHLMPHAKDENKCTMDGLICLSLGFDELMRKTERCDCKGSCTETEIKILGSTSTQNFSGFKNEDSITRINVILQAPTVRYIRKVVNGYLDLIVSIGGTAGLCVGASLLTTVEILYYLCVRPLSDRVREKRQRKRHRIRRKNRALFPFVN